MNTREREVMSMSRHSRAMLLNVLWHHQGASSAVGQPIRALLGIGESDALNDEQVAEAKWIDALLAEGSASSEVAEAVDSAFNRPMFGRMIEADFEQSTATFEMEPGYYAAAGRFEIRRPQPAQGEQCSALEVFRIAGGDTECTPNPTAEVAMDCLRDLRKCYDELLSEQRSCEGSDDGEAQRASAWLAVVSVLNEVAPTWHRDSIGTGREQVCAAIRALAQRASEQRPLADEVVELSSSLEEDAALLRGLIDDGVPPADDLDRIADSMERASAFLKSAHPRVRPAGSDAVRELVEACEAEFGCDAEVEGERLFPDDDKVSFPEERCNITFGHIRRARAALDATAEQPSCGQDARDAARYHSLRAVIIGTHPIAHQLTAKDPTTEAEVDAIADEAIAAQQRQGGEK